MAEARRLRALLAALVGALALLGARPCAAAWPFGRADVPDDDAGQGEPWASYEDDYEGLDLWPETGGGDNADVFEERLKRADGSEAFDVRGAIRDLNDQLARDREPASSDLPLAPSDPARLPPPPELATPIAPPLKAPPLDGSAFTSPTGAPPPPVGVPPGALEAAAQAMEGGAKALWPMSPELVNAVFPNASAQGEERMNVTRWWIDREARGKFNESKPDDPRWLQELQTNGTLFGEGSGSSDRFENFTSRDYALLAGAPVVVLEKAFRAANASAMAANQSALEFVIDAERIEKDFVIQAETLEADIEARRQEVILFAANCTEPAINNCSNVVKIIDGELERYAVGYNTSELIELAQEAERKRKQLMQSGGLLACCNPTPTHFLRYVGQKNFTRIYDDQRRPTPWNALLYQAHRNKTKKYSVGGHELLSTKETIWRRDVSEGGACAPMFQCVPCTIQRDGEKAELCPSEMSDPKGPWGGCKGVCLPCMLGDFCPGGTVNMYAHTLASVCPDGHYCPPLGLNLSLPAAKPPAAPSSTRRHHLDRVDQQFHRQLLQEEEGQPSDATDPSASPAPLEAPHAWLVPCPEGQICPAGMPLLSPQTSCQGLLMKGIRKAMKHRDTLFKIAQNSSSGYYCPQAWSGYDTITTPDNAFKPCPKGAFCPSASERVKCPDGTFCRKRSSSSAACPWSSNCEGKGNESPSPAWARTLSIFIFLGVLWEWYRYTSRAIERAQRRADESFENNVIDNKVALENCKAIVKEFSGDATWDNASPGEGNGSADSEAASSFLKVKVPVTIRFDEIHLFVGEKTILSNISGSFKSYEMTALMGPSGCGKSSLMNVICGRAGYGKVTGKVLINREEVEPGTVGGAPLGYVPQEDTVYGDLTVRENLEFSAQLRLPSSDVWTNEKKEALVKSVLDIIGLAHIKHSLVGDVKKRGISGGQKKRVNVGVEMVTDPTLLFLDEPTSGLGATDTLELMGALASVADTGRTIAAVIHQPRYQVFQMFHTLFLLGRGGQAVYVGPTSDALRYFEGPLGFDCPENENPADFFMDCVGGLALDKTGAVPNLDELFAKWRDTETIGLERALAHEGNTNPGQKRESTGANLLEELKNYLDAPPSNGADAYGNDVAQAQDASVSNAVGGGNSMPPLSRQSSRRTSNSSTDNQITAMIWSRVMSKRRGSKAFHNAEDASNGDPTKPKPRGRMSSIFTRARSGSNSRTVIEPRQLPGRFVQLRWMLVRLIEQKVRAFSALIGRMLSLCMAGLAVGIFMSSDYQVYEPRDDKLAMVAVMMSAISACFASVNSCAFFAADGPMRKREELSGVSAPMSFLSRTLIDFVEHLWASAFFLGMSYNFVLPEMPFAMFWALVTAGSFAAGGIGILASEAVAESNQALVSTMSALVSCIFINGVIGVHYKDVKTMGATWLWALSPGRWVVEGILVGELRTHATEAYQELIIRATVGDSGLGFYPRWSTEKEFERWLWKRHLGMSTAWDDASTDQRIKYSQEKSQHWIVYLDNVVTTSVLANLIIGGALRVMALCLRMYTPLMLEVWRGFAAIAPAGASWLLERQARLSAHFNAFANSTATRLITRGIWFEKHIVRPMKSLVRTCLIYPTILCRCLTNTADPGAEAMHGPFLSACLTLACQTTKLASPFPITSVRFCCAPASPAEFRAYHPHRCVASCATVRAPCAWEPSAGTHRRDCNDASVTYTVPCSSIASARRRCRRRPCPRRGVLVVLLGSQRRPSTGWRTATSMDSPWRTHSMGLAHCYQYGLAVAGDPASIGTCPVRAVALHPWHARLATPKRTP